MAVKTRVVTTYTCDLCGSECDEKSNVIDYKISNGFMDSGPLKIQGRVTAYIPYGTADGHLCRSCTIKHLRDFVDSEDGEK